jgi:uncharacterized membrane protein
MDDEALLGFIIIGLVTAWMVIFRSQSRISKQQKEIAGLMRRLWVLEQQGHAPAVVAKADVAVVPVPQPVVAAAAVVAPTPVPPPVPVIAAQPVAAASQPGRPQKAMVYPTVPPPVPSPRKPRSSQEWEALIGGNIFNKVGALLVVIGIMWIMSYYAPRMGPAGRAAGCALASLALLATGVWVERREKYRMFAGGLIGGGWAALYATSYAIYALPAARIIDNPFIGSLLVLLVAAGMIGHSLRYHAQGMTAVAFFSAFAALAITPSTLFAVLALIPLAGAVLYLAQRFDWYLMALMGVFATYGACAAHGASGAPLLESESLFIVYWVLFEVFDIMRFSRRVSDWAVELIFPLNAAGFLGLSYASWTSKSPETLWKLSVCAALLYSLSALWRVKIEIDRGFDHSADLPTRIRAGSFEAPLALGAFLTATAIVQELTGAWMSTALAMEAQALFTAGIRFRSRFLRGLAVLGFAVSLLNVVDMATSHATQVNVLGHMMYAWVVLLLFHALLFYVNRAMSEKGSVIGTGFSWVASSLVAVALRQEIQVNLLGTAWLAFGAILFELGVREKLIEFRWQAYALGFFAAIQTTLFYKDGTSYPWVALAIATAIYYAAAWRVATIEKADAANEEWNTIGWLTCGATAFFGAFMICIQVPAAWGTDQYIGAVLWGFALVLLELGLQRLPSRLRMFAYPVASLATFAVVGANGDKFVKYAQQPVWLSYFVAAAAAWIMSGRLATAAPEQATEFERTAGRSVACGFAAFFALCALWLVVPNEFVPVAWAAMGLALLEVGNAFEVQAYRLQAQAVAVIAAFSAFFFVLPDEHPHRILAIALLIAVHIGFRIRSVAAAGIEGQLPAVHTVASSILAAALIYQEVSGGMLTIAWGAEALVLLGAGFAVRDRWLRLEGLGLFLVCVLKLFLYDLRNLDTPYRILSFIALGLILLGVSWIYTRFREQLQKLL